MLVFSHSKSSIPDSQILVSISAILPSEHGGVYWIACLGLDAVGGAAGRNAFMRFSTRLRTCFIQLVLRRSPAISMRPATPVQLKLRRDKAETKL
jgi:hypothetical protein